MNLKPFDLEKALAGEPVVTRSGIKKVLEIVCFKTNITFPVRVLCAGGGQYSTTKKGRYCNGEDSGNDLFMAPTYSIEIEQ